MLILLTNDDGISAPGLIAMYRQLVRLGDVVVVAPASVQSATGHGITLSTPLLTNRVCVAEGLFTGVAVEGRPADCVKLAVSHFLPRPPDLVVSGLNSGANVGINVIYSGTVAAAIEGAFLGLPSIALSLHLRPDAPPDYLRASTLAMQAVERIVQAGLTAGEVVTVNIPGLKPTESPAGFRVVRQSIRPWTDDYERRVDPRGREYFWNKSVFTLIDDQADTDISALRDRHITITPLQFDLTDHAALDKWRGAFAASGINTSMA